MKESEPLQRRMQPDKRRSQLIESAIKATAEHGIARVTHSQVARISGVSVPTVHAYFRTRADLVDTVLATVDELLSKNTSKALAANTSVRERLFRVALGFAQDARERPDLILVWLDWSTGVRSPVWDRYQVWLNQLHRQVEDLLREELADILSPRDIAIRARLYVGGGHTLALMQFAGAKPGVIRRTSEDMARQALLRD